MQLRPIIVAAGVLSAAVWCVPPLALFLVVWNFGCASIRMRSLPMSPAGVQHNLNIFGGGVSRAMHS